MIIFFSSYSILGNFSPSLLMLLPVRPPGGMSCSPSSTTSSSSAASSSAPSASSSIAVHPFHVTQSTLAASSGGGRLPAGEGSLCGSEFSDSGSCVSALDDGMNPGGVYYYVKDVMKENLSCFKKNNYFEAKDAVSTSWLSKSIKVTLMLWNPQEDHLE